LFISLKRKTTYQECLAYNKSSIQAIAEIFGIVAQKMLIFAYKKLEAVRQVVVDFGG